MSRKRISHSARLKGPPPEQIRRRNLVIGILVVAAVALVATIAVGMNREANPVANNSPKLTSTKTAGGATGQTAAASKPTGAQSTAASQQPVVPASLQADKSAHRVTIDTARGQIVMEVYPDLMPVTVANFDKLVKAGFYNGLTFHRVEDWVIQGGDPKGNGTGGSGQTIKLETNPQLKNVRGAVAMARSSDPNSASSQFYILKQDQSSLDGQYAVFGMVVQGMSVVDQIQIGDRMLTVKE
jgi:peptidyl-prolyl cis-trans isomerase B (cyclophilin B)